MEIIDSKIQANLLQEFTAKYLEEHKELVEHIRETTKKQLLIFGVSQQRELLLAYERSQYETTWWMSEAEATNRINDFLANNCG